MNASPVHSSRPGPARHEVTSEVAYDLLQDHLDTILALLDRPLARAELLARLGSPAVLDRMLRHGLVEQEGDTFRAKASIYHQLRQEGMITFLERYILPGIVASTASSDDDSGFAAVHNLDLTLTRDEMRGLRQGPVQGLIDQLAAITDRPAQGVVSKLTVLVVGTSRTQDVARVADDQGDRALAVLQSASSQRANPDERDLAVMTQVDGLVDNARYAASIQALEEFVHRFADQRASSRDAGGTIYHLTVASHWRCAEQTHGKGLLADESPTRETC